MKRVEYKFRGKCMKIHATEQISSFIKRTLADLTTTLFPIHTLSGRRETPLCFQRRISLRSISFIFILMECILDQFIEVSVFLFHYKLKKIVKFFWGNFLSASSSCSRFQTLKILSTFTISKFFLILGTFLNFDSFFS